MEDKDNAVVLTKEEYDQLMGAWMRVLKITCGDMVELTKEEYEHMKKCKDFVDACHLVGMLEVSLEKIRPFITLREEAHKRIVKEVLEDIKDGLKNCPGVAEWNYAKHGYDHGYYRPYVMNLLNGIAKKNGMEVEDEK